jgi:hypothetical protein
VSAGATDNVGVTSLTLSIDNSVVAVSNTGSVSYRWSTRKVTKGPHTITATAKDKANNSASATVTVSTQ